ncbi:hypothetical protein AVEN_182508-1 [Araneus ventricosus]|uniref:Uncharacterized protein n=1 Tax=Araneus ventricosus TaxID=182803 RepID=A0A4Y2C0N3_ARAVE|nr:hypothetical protein AVEN_182508-1 [Araneus ventricosus]
MASQALSQRSVVHRYTTVFEYLLPVGIRAASPYPRCTQNLQQSVRSVLRSPSVDSLPLIPEHLPTSLLNVQAIPQTLAQQRFFAVPRKEARRTSSKEGRTTDH